MAGDLFDLSDEYEAMLRMGVDLVAMPLHATGIGETSSALVRRLLDAEMCCLLATPSLIKRSTIRFRTMNRPACSIASWRASKKNAARANSTSKRWRT